MASVTWTQTTSGLWSSPGAWSTGAAPLNGDDVTINPGAPVTVTYTTGTLKLDTLTTGAGDTLDVTGGTLATTIGYTLGGAVVVGGGTLRLDGTFGLDLESALTVSSGNLMFDTNASIGNGGALSQTGGTITINHGTFTDGDNVASLAGTVTGSGELTLFNLGTLVIQSGCVLSVAETDISLGTVFLNENLSYGRDFTLGASGTLDLNGNVATFSGLSAFEGDVRGGSLALTGTGHLNGLVLDNGAAASLTGTYNQTGAITLGSGTGTGSLTIGKTGMLRIVGVDSVGEGAGGSILVNAGTIEKTGGGAMTGEAVIYTQILSTGIIDSAIGVLDFSGPGGGSASTISGTLEGAGTVAFGSGFYVLGGNGASLTMANYETMFDGSVQVTLASAISYAGIWDQTNGLILVDNTLALSGYTALDGGEMKGTGTITVSGPLHLGFGMDLEGNLTFDLNTPSPELITQTGAISIGSLSDSVDQVFISQNTTWLMEGASGISGAFGTITNNGIFEKANGTSNVTVASELFNNNALIVNAGTLSLSGQGTLAGSVSGSAVLDISGGFALAAGLSLSVGELILDLPSQANVVQADLQGNLTYSHDFAMEGGTLGLNGNTLTLSGVTSLVTGAVMGSGALLVDGPATIGYGLQLTQGANLQLDGFTQQSGNVVLTGGATAPILTIAAGSTYEMGSNVSIGGQFNTIVGTVAVSGTLVTSSAGMDIIAATIVDKGQINISHGEMQFLGPLTGTGGVTLSAGGILDLDNTALVSTGITFGTGGGELYLQAPSDFAGTIAGFASGDEVELNGFSYVGTAFAVSGNDVTITESSGMSITLAFTTAQTMSSLALGEGSHGGLTLVHL